MNRVRRNDESFKKYRKNLVLEQRAMDQRLKSKLLYVASTPVPNPVHGIPSTFNNYPPAHMKHVAQGEPPQGIPVAVDGRYYVA